MNENSYQQITQEAAKEMMDTQEVVILDVREQEVHQALTTAGLVIERTGAKEDWRSLVAGRAEA